MKLLRKSRLLEIYTEITLRISPTRYRVAVLAVVVGDEGNYPTRPPQFVVEIVSEDDRFVDIATKLAEYHAWAPNYEKKTTYTVTVQLDDVVYTAQSEAIFLASDSNRRSSSSTTRFRDAFEVRHWR